MQVTFRFSTLALAAAATVSIASATPIGILSIANVAGGGVTISARRIDFFPTMNAVGSPAGVGDFGTGGNTAIAAGGSILTATTNPYGQMKDIDIGAGSITNFIQFYTSVPVLPGVGPLQPVPVFDLTVVQPGGSAQGALGNCAGITAVGTSCSPLITFGGTPFVSPFVLTNRGIYTDVSLGVTMVARDGVGTNSLWEGGFTAQVVGLTPNSIQVMLNAGSSITNTYSATFSGGLQEELIPEPATLSLIGLGLALAGLLGRRRRRS